MNSIRVSSLVIAMVGLAGCGPTRQEIAANDAEACASYGVKFGTPEYAQCRMERDQRRDQNRLAAAQLFLNNQANVAHEQNARDMALMNSFRQPAQ